MKKIQDIMLIRVLCQPCRDFLRRRKHERYLRSPDSWYLKTLKGIHAGKRCFIIGNGPSLCAADLDQLKGEYTFAANRIYEIFEQTKWRPTYYLIADAPIPQERYDIIKRNASKLGHMFIRVDTRNAQDEKKSLDYPIEKLTRIFYEQDGYFKIYQNVWNQWSSYVSEDISDHFSDGCTVTFTSIQLAIYMGFTEIYLFGVDFSYSVMYDADGKLHKDESIQDYFTGERYKETVFNYNSMLHAYQIAKEYCDNHNIKIMNATRGGKLEVFERTSLEKILRGGYGMK